MQLKQRRMTQVSVSAVVAYAGALRSAPGTGKHSARFTQSITSRVQRLEEIACLRPFHLA